MHLFNLFLSKNLPFLIILVSIGTYFSPFYLDVPSSVPSFLLGFVIFCTGLSMDINSLKDIRYKKRELFLASFLKWVLTVSISIFLAYSFFLSKPEIAAGLLLSGTVPSATSATVYTFLAGGNTSLVIAASLVDVMISPIITPLALLGLSSEQITISFWSLLQSFFTIVVIPLGIGLAIQKRIPSFSHYSKAVTKLGSSLALLFIVHTIVGSGRNAIASEITLLPLLSFATFIQVSFPMIAAYFIAKKLHVKEEDARAILFQAGLCNTALAAILAHQFIGELATIAPILNMIFNLSIGAFLANFFAQLDEKRAYTQQQKNSNDLAT